MARSQAGEMLAGWKCRTKIQLINSDHPSDEGGGGNVFLFHGERETQPLKWGTPKGVVW